MLETWMSPSLIQSTLFLLIPLFSIALIVLASSHSPHPPKPQAIRAYIYIASVTLLATLAGALPLSHSSNSLSESLIQALLFLFIGIPVLDLAPTYVPQLSIRRLHTSILVITLSIATLSALISPFLPTATPLLYISPSLFLLYTIQSIPRIAYILHNFLYPEDSIQIPLTTHPSPASTASFPVDTPKHHHKIPSISTTSTITVVDRTRTSFPPSQQDQLRSQILNSRSRSLLVFILAVQLALLAANACALAVTISARHNPSTLKTIQTVCTVLALTGSMSAYLLHTYNLHLGQTPSTPSYNNLSTHSPDQPQMIESHSNSLSPILIQLAPPPLAKVRRKHANPGMEMTSSDSDLELNAVSVEEGGTFSALEKREKEKIQEYYLSSSSSPSTGSPSSPFSPFERCGTETDPSSSSPDTPYPYGEATCDDGAINANQVRKRSSFFGWEFAWDQEALDRADDTGKLRNASGGSPVRWKSASNHTKKVQPLLIVDQESFTDRELSSSLLMPHSLSSEAEVGGGKVKRGMSWRSSVCGVVGREKAKRKNTLGLGIGMKPLRLSRSFGGTSNNSGGGGRGSVTGPGNGREMGHRTILSGDTGPMCGLSLKRKATALMGGQRSPVAPSAAVSSRVMGQDATRITMITIATPVPTNPKKPKKKTIPAAESEMGERNGKNNHSIGFIHGDSDSDNDELDEDVDADADEEADLQRTPTIKSTRSYSHSPQSYRHSSSSSPQRHETATSENHGSSINESCISTASTNTNSPQKLSPSLTRRGLSLKRSFKMGSAVGRTLGPGLTLSSLSFISPGSGSGPLLTSTSPYKSIRRRESERLGFKEEEEKRECEEKEKKGGKNLDGENVEKAEKVGKEDDEDVDVEAEMRPPGAGANASYARATATAAISTPDTGTDVGVNIGGGGFASRCGSTTQSKSIRPLLPTINTTTTVSSLPTCSITEQYQQPYQQDEHNSGFSTAVWKPHPVVGWFRPSETSTSRSDADIVSLEQEMEVIRRSDKGNGLSSLPLLPPLQPLLLRPMSPPPAQSQSLPPTPTKSKSTLLGKPSISSFKKRSAPPALPPLPGSSEWAHSISTMSGMGGAAVSMVSLVHSRSHSMSKPPSQPPSRPTTPKLGMRLSAMNMGTVRNAFAGVGAKVSARMSINSASTRGSANTASHTVAPSVGMGMGIDDIDGDFMDLRDPFASPPPSKLINVCRGGDHTGGGNSDFWLSERAMSSLGGGGAGVVEYDDDDDSVEVGITRRISGISGGKRRVNMNAWGRLPMPSTLPLPGSAPEAEGSSGSVSLLVANRKKAHSHHGERRKHKEKRARKVAAAAAGGDVLVERNSSLGCNAGEEDADFGVEEALLSQRLLKRLDSVEWD